MKSLYKLLFLSIIVVAFSCQDNDDDFGKIENQINGKWNLVKVSGGFGGINHQFEPGIITWKFNSDNKTVTVVNNNTDSTILNDGLETGVYNYQVKVVNDSELDFCHYTITIDDNDMGCLSLIDNNLIIDQSFVDGFRLEFKK
jgi:hypothetical protein